MSNRKHSVIQRISTAVFAIQAMVMAAPFSAYAGFLNGNPTSITINMSVSASTIINRMLGIIVGLFVVVGIFKSGISAFAILEAYSDDNNAGISKGIKQLGIGLCFIAAPLLIAYLFS